MQLTARLTQHLDPETGNGPKGPYVRRRFVVTTETQYPKTIQIDAYDNERNKPILSATPGDMLKVDFDIQSKDYKGKWHTSATAHKIEIVSDPVGQPRSQRPSVATQPPMPRPAKPTRTYTPDPQSFDGDDDNLPFNDAASPVTHKPIVAAGGIEIPMAVWQQPQHSYDADRIKTLDSLHQVLQVIVDPPSLTYLRDSFRLMRGYHKEKHPLYDQHEGFRDVYRAINTRANDLDFFLSAGRFHHKR